MNSRAIPNNAITDACLPIVGATILIRRIRARSASASCIACAEGSRCRFAC